MVISLDKDMESYFPCNIALPVNVVQLSRNLASLQDQAACF